MVLKVKLEIRESLVLKVMRVIKVRKEKIKVNQEIKEK